MKKITITFLFITPLLLFSCNSNKLTLEEVIKKVNQAQGNSAKIKLITDQKQEWNMTDSKGIKFKCIYLYKRPDKLKMLIIMPKLKPITILYNGGKGKIDVFGKMRDMSPEEINQYEPYVSTWLDGFQNYKSKDGLVKLLKDTKIDGVKYHVIQVKDKNNNESKLYITEDGNIEITETSQINFVTKKVEPAKVINKNYKNFNGINMSTQKISIDTKNSKTVLTLEKLQNNIGLTDDEFKIQ